LGSLLKVGEEKAMRPVVLAAAAVLLTVPAMAQDRGASSREAARFLRSCDGLAGDDVQWCTINRAEFPRMYGRAHAGDYQAQRNVAFLLRGSQGIARDRVESCAWRLIIVAQRHPQLVAGDTDNVRVDCGPLDQRDRAAAQARALALVDRITEQPQRRR
jgi:hypothetical protein